MSINIFHYTFSDNRAIEDVKCQVVYSKLNNVIKVSKLKIDFKYKRQNITFIFTYNNKDNQNVVLAYVNQDRITTRLPFHIKQDTQYLKELDNQSNTHEERQIFIPIEQALSFVEHQYQQYPDSIKNEIYNQYTQLFDKVFTTKQMNKHAAKIPIFKKDGQYYFETRNFNNEKILINKINKIILSTLILNTIVMLLLLFLIDMSKIVNMLCVTELVGVIILSIFIVIFIIASYSEEEHKYISETDLVETFNRMIQHSQTKEVFRLYDFITIDDNFDNAILDWSDEFKKEAYNHCDYEYLNIDRLNIKLQMLANNKKLRQQLKTNQNQIKLMNGSIEAITPYYREMQQLHNEIKQLQANQSLEYDKLLKENADIIQKLND